MLKSFLNKIIKEDGFLLETSDKKIYTIGHPVKEKPVKLKLHSKLIEYKLAFFSDFYFGKGWTDGELTVENGNLSEILDICLKNIGRKERLHSDAIMYDLNSPEAFDEFFFSINEKYIKEELINYINLILISAQY